MWTVVNILVYKDLTGTRMVFLTCDLIAIRDMETSLSGNNTMHSLVYVTINQVEMLAASPSKKLQRTNCYNCSTATDNNNSKTRE